MQGKVKKSKTDFRHALDFLDCERDVRGHDRRRRRHEIVILAVHLPREIVPNLALRHPERGIAGGEHHEALVGKDDLGIDAVADLILNPCDGIGARVAAQTILAVLTRHVRDHPRTHARFAQALGDEPLFALGVDLDMGQAVAILRVEPLAPQAARFVGVTIRGDHQVPVGIAGPRRASPSFVAGRLQPPAIFFVNLDNTCLTHLMISCFHV